MKAFELRGAAEQVHDEFRTGKLEGMNALPAGYQ
jgi:hypothetical protein